MGSMKSLLGMMPGIGKALKDLPIEEKQIDRTEAMIQSMTSGERKDVDMLDNSRRRIARGSGVDQKDVSQLVKGFEMVAAMGQQMSGMGDRLMKPWPAWAERTWPRWHKTPAWAGARARRNRSPSTSSQEA